MQRILFFLTGMVLSASLWAQAPNGFNYQAVARNTAGEPLVNKSISVRFSIIQDNPEGTVVYSEAHQATTNELGLFDLIIGDGTVELGSMENIGWEDHAFFIKIELDPEGGSNYREMGKSPLLAVPYALHANTVTHPEDDDADPQNEIQDLQLHDHILTLSLNGEPTEIDLKSYLDNTDNQTLDFTGDTLSILNGNHLVFPYDSSSWYVDRDNLYYMKGKVGIGNKKPGSQLEVQADPASTEKDTLFAVKDKNGQTVFAVFPDGAKVYVGSNSKGVVGGFAVSGRAATKGSEYDVLRVTPDSTRIYVNETTLNKGIPGGFAVSGRSATKGIHENIFLTTSDSTRIYVDQSGKGQIGGFAVSGRAAGKGLSNKFLQLNADNYFIGQESGSKITTGLYNSFFGYQAGKSNTTGNNNVFLGYQAGFSNEGANNNVFIGNESGYHITSGHGNVYLGFESGRNDEQFGQLQLILRLPLGQDQFRQLQCFLRTLFWQQQQWELQCFFGLWFRI